MLVTLVVFGGRMISSVYIFFLQYICVILYDYYFMITLF